jgi:coronin-1B/1C/6
MSRIVRQSKYRHVFGKAFKKEKCYDNIKLSRNAWDSNYICANLKFFAVCVEAAGGGSFVVVPFEAKGKLKSDYPLVAGHKAAVLDVDFNPFNDTIIASASEDGTAKLWNIPEGGLTDTMRDAVQNLTGHKRKVGTVNWNPTAANVLATSSTDYSVKLWDVEKGAAPNTVDGHGNIIQTVSWNYDGSQIVTACKDKKIRVLDPRSNSIVGEVAAHDGVKGSRAIFLGNTGKILSVGFSKTSDRQYSIWDPSNLAAPLASENIDTASGQLMPFYDNDTGVLFLSGKGDGNVRYYELTDDGTKLYYLSQYTSSVPARGMCALPKLGCKTGKCEIARLLKLTPTTMEPISFQVPRKGADDVFQDDIFPPTAAPEPTVSAEEWFSGKTVAPKLISLEGGFKPKDKPAASFNPDMQKEDEGPATEKELREEWKKQKDRIAYLESEIAKRDARIKELSN